MTPVEHAAGHPLVMTSAERARLQAQIEHDMTVAINMAERIGRGELSASCLDEYERLLRSVAEMRETLDQAVSPAEAPVADDDVVHVGDEVVLWFSKGEIQRYTLVHPIEACVDDGRLSVASDVGSALTGARVGDAVVVPDARGPRTAYVRSRRRTR